MIRTASGVHPLASHRTVKVAEVVSEAVFVLSKCALTFGLAIVAQEGWVDDNAVKRALEFSGQLKRSLKVVVHKLLKHAEPLVNLKQLDLRPALVLPGRLYPN